MVCHPLHGQAKELLMKLEENLLLLLLEDDLKRPRQAWIREEMERVEDFCYTCKPKYQKL